MKKSDYLKQLDVTAFLERPEVEAYVGKNYPHFKALWQKDYAKTGSASKMGTRWHWNNLAFFMPIAWFAYRKMWGSCGSLTALFVCAIFLEGYAQANWNYKNSGTNYLGLFLALAIISKNIYFFHITEFFRKHKDTPPQILLPLAEKTGGVSVLYSVLVSIGFLAALIGAAFISEFIWPSPLGDEIDTSQS